MEWLSLTNVLLLLIFIALSIICIYLQYIFEAVERNEQSTRVGNNRLEESNQSLSDIKINTNHIKVHSKEININTSYLKTSKN